MSRIGKGLLAGLAATVVLSVLMVIKTMMSVMPQLDLPKLHLVFGAVLGWTYGKLLSGAPRAAPIGGRP